jgi:IS5 family transposase
MANPPSAAPFSNSLSFGSPTLKRMLPKPRPRRVRDQERGQRGPKVYSLHAPEVECMGRHQLKRGKGGQFVIHAQALPGNPYDGHTLARIIPAIEERKSGGRTRPAADRGR